MIIGKEELRRGIKCIEDYQEIVKIKRELNKNSISFELHGTLPYFRALQLRYL